MASAVLASQNESSWAHMGKIPFLNPNPNPNPNPKKKQKQFHHHPNGVVPSGRYPSVNGDSPAVTQTASDDAYSFNQTSTSRPSGNYGRYLSFNLAAFSKSDLLELKKRLSSELDQIRDLRDRIETGRVGVDYGNPNRSQPKLKKGSGNKRPVAGFVDKGSVVKKSNGFVVENGIVAAEADAAVDYEGLLKECGKIVSRLLKHKYAYIFKAPVDAKALGLHDYHRIVKRPMDLGTVKSNLGKNLYRTPNEFAADMRLTFNNALLYNPKTDPVNGMAEQMLARFEELYKPIQEKMDSLVNSRRERGSREFRAVDELQYRSQEEVQGSSWNNHHSNNMVLPSPPRVKKMKPKMSPVPGAPPVSKKPERMQMPMQAHSSVSTPVNPPPPQPVIQQPVVQEQFPPSPVRAPSQPVKEPKSGRALGLVKQPKPRAKDPNKREMSMEEKQKLGLGLQTLPQEKMPQLVQIIRKRNEHLAQDGDEIELDIEALDTETLWELDRFVTNWKKMVSKTKRQALMMTNTPAGGVAAPSTPTAEADMGGMSDKNDDSVKKLKDNEDEDVDIDDDMPATSFPPVEIEKDEGAGGGVGGGQDQDHDDRGNASSSSSSSGDSSSDSSSSSDSDSGSSSGSDSDADDAQS